MIKLKNQLRLRVFAGPNGSGKSTLINTVRNFRINGNPIDFGVYVNADDIAQDLLTKKGVSLRKYNFTLNDLNFRSFALESGLINENFSLEKFQKSYYLINNKIHIKHPGYVDNLAQIISNFLIHKLLEMKVKYSFETVFSHESKLNIMKQARDAGYKVYFYFIATESPDINIERVLARREKGGHNVPDDKIRSRYFRTLNFLYKASQVAYQAFYFDNSAEELKMFANFKVVKGKKQWNKNKKAFPEWFKIYYSKKPNRS